jgi:hypothetical protein
VKETRRAKAADQGTQRKHFGPLMNADKRRKPFFAYPRLSAFISGQSFFLQPATPSACGAIVSRLLRERTGRALE